MHNCYSSHAYMHSYCSTSIYYFISFFSLFLSVSLVALAPALTLTSLSLPLPLIIRERHTCITENATYSPTEKTTSKNFFQNQVKQEISITQNLFGCREKHKETRNKEINPTQRKSTLFHHFLTNQTRNKEN